jgi:hypothetical protein
MYLYLKCNIKWGIRTTKFKVINQQKMTHAMCKSLEKNFYFGTPSFFDCVFTLKQYVIPIPGSGVNIELFSHDLDINVNVHQVSNPLQHKSIPHFIMNKWIWIPIPLAWWRINHLHEDVMGNGCKCASTDSNQIPTFMWEQVEVVN